VGKYFLIYFLLFTFYFNFNFGSALYPLCNQLAIFRNFDYLRDVIFKIFNGALTLENRMVNHTFSHTISILYPLKIKRLFYIIVFQWLIYSLYGIFLYSRINTMSQHAFCFAGHHIINRSKIYNT